MATPAVMLPYQVAWLTELNRIRVAEKSRRIGWSWCSAAEVTLEAAKTDGCDAWYIGYNADMAREYIRDCAFWARCLDAATSHVEQGFFDGEDDADKSILTFAIRFVSGFRVTALSSRPTNLRGKRGHIIIDEAAFHDDLPGLMKAAVAVLMWGGTARVDIISTHNGTDNYFNKLCEEVRAGKRPYALHRCTLDEAISQGLFKRICEVNGWEWSTEREVAWRTELFAQYGDDAAEELLCVPARSGGTYLPRDLLERQMRPGQVVRLTLEDGFVGWAEPARIGHVEQWCNNELRPLLEKFPKEQMCFFGEDFGRVSDRTVIAIGYLAQDLVRKFPVVLELSNVPFEQQKQVLFYAIDRLPKFVKGALDATGNGAYLAEVAAQRYGADRIEQVSLSEKFYAEHLPKLKDCLEDELLEPVRDADHLLDLSAFKVINGLPRLPKSKTPTAGSGPLRHGDAGIAYLLGHYASCLPVSDYGYQSAPKRVRAVLPLQALGSRVRQHEEAYRPAKRHGSFM